MVKVEQFECNSIYLQSSIGLLGFNKFFKLKKSKEIFFQPRAELPSAQFFKRRTRLTVLESWMVRRLNFYAYFFRLFQCDWRQCVNGSTNAAILVSYSYFFLIWIISMFNIFYLHRKGSIWLQARQEILQFQMFGLLFGKKRDYGETIIPSF